MPLPFDSAIVLGSDGFLGHHIVRRLRARNVAVTAIGRAAGDLSDARVTDAILADAPRAPRIFHLVTRQRTGPVQHELQGELLAINARIHLNVLDAWRRHQPQAKLISTGSSCAYPERDRPLRESDFLTAPLQDSVRGYGLAKQVLAVGCETYGAQYGLTYLHLVLATIYGPGDHQAPDRSHFMTGMIARAVEEQRAGRRQMSVWGAPDTVRDLLYVDDQIDAMLEADSVFTNRIVHCSANAPVTIDVCARAIRDALSWSAEIIYPPGSFNGTSYKSLDSSPLLRATRFAPRVGLREGIARVLAADFSRQSLSIAP